MTVETPQDAEKSAGVAAVTTSASSSEDLRNENPLPLRVPDTLQKLNARIEGLAGFEARGITRVLPEERQPASSSADLQVALMWFSANISVNNLAVGLLGPLLFGLGFLDSAMCAVFGGLLGSITTAYMSIWGPQSGNRTMVGI
jgi:Permease for cytosine/purines, uracil, thiamine, allantoin